MISDDGGVGPQRVDGEGDGGLRVVEDRTIPNDQEAVDASIG